MSSSILLSTTALRRSQSMLRKSTWSLTTRATSSARYPQDGIWTPKGSEIENRPVILELEDGLRLNGYSFGAENSVEGEIVFSTGMMGYVENLTDPSYQGQFLISTYPLVGNYGVPPTAEIDKYGLPARLESISGRIHANAFIAQDYSHHYSHWKAVKSLGQWLTEEGVPGISGIDTRMLSKRIRDRGAMLARITFEDNLVVGSTFGEPIAHPSLRNLVGETSCKEVKVWNKGGDLKVVCVDFGLKTNMIRNLVDRNCEVHQVPWNYDYSKMTYDGLFLSNGPGDPSHPEMIAGPQKVLRKVLKQSEDVPDAMAVPIFGICMGNQILGRAVGCTTYKMQFGNRGQNQPVSNHVTNECYVTPQNHGYAIDTTNLPKGWNPLFTNTNDGTNEGIAHETKPWCTAQFHPEARSGPLDTGFLFDLFVKNMQERKTGGGARSFPEMFRQHDDATRGGRLLGHAAAAKIAKDAPPVKKIVMLGSGGLSIGQAGEFDYSGSQAIKAFKEEGVEVVLINPNIASVQTNDTTASDFQADTVYFLPVTHDYVEEILKRERPDGIVLSMGGQTGLNTGVELYERGTLDKYDCRVLGTSVTAIMNTEDRDRFSVRLNEINESMAPSVAVENDGTWMSSSLSNPASGKHADGVEAAVAAATDPVHGIGFPCMIRSAYALGGLGSGICQDEAHMREMVPRAFASSPQILVEKSMLGWKEVEYEVVRDINDNCVTVCNMENFDPLGVHTGDSIVVAPSQTLDNDEYHMLRETSIKVVRHLGIVGECNIQYALHPTSQEYCIIEVNPRLSRSSALASKATGYPLAFVAAKLALGHDLSVLRNSVTHTTTACFEPSLDYVVVKVPRWDLKKFDKVSRSIGSGMKSIGEVMAVGRSFEESFQKALRMTDPAISGFDPIHYNRGDENIIDNLYPEHDSRVHALAAAMAKGMTVEELHDRTKIDKWYLHKLEKISSLRRNLQTLQSADQITATSMRGLKRAGFSDVQIGRLTGTTEDDIRQKRKGMGILPVVKQIDTMAAEFPAATNYLYMTYNGDEHDVTFEDKGSIVLGSGVYRIGSSVEFDWCSVSAIRTLRKMGRKSVMVNYNPETVSTDYDECDRLYFEELSLERVQDIYEAEQAENLMVSVGGQIPNTLAMGMDAANINILGTSPDMIDRAEDRNRFSAMCDEYGIDQPQWASLTDSQAAFDFCDRVGYPVLVRPSYVLSGAAMAVAYNAGELMTNLQNATEVSAKYPVVISEFIEGGREIDVDAVAHNGKVIPGALAIAEHVENAGVHSGDATLMIPPQTLTASDLAMTRETMHKVAEALNITGPFNMQLIAKDGCVKIIETNLRASRSAPFSSKTIGTDLIEVATKAMLHKPGDPPVTAVDGLINFEVNTDGTEGDGPYVGIKSPMFSWKRLLGADPTLGVEMASTGEVACYGRNKHEAFLLSLLSTTFAMPQKKKVLVSIEKTLRADFTKSLELLHEQDYDIYATELTAEFIKTQTDIPVTMLHWLGSNQSPSIEEVCRNKEIDLVFMFANSMSVRTEMNYDIRRLVSDFNIPLITNLQVAELFAEATQKLAAGEIELEPLHLKEHYARAGRS